MKRFVIVCLFLTFLGCAHSPELENLHPVGSKYRGEIKLGEKVIPLPDGVWELAANGSLEQFFQISLIKKYPFGRYNMVYILVDKPILKRKYGYVKNPRLNYKTIYYKVVKNNVQGEAQDAWNIEIVNNDFLHTGNDTFLRQIAKYLENNNLSMSGIFMMISHRLTSWKNKKDFIIYRYNIDPDTRNVELGNWKNWLPENLKPDNYISNFINQLKIYGEEQHEKIKQGLGHPFVTK